MDALLQLGREEEASALLARIDADQTAPADARAAARRAHASSSTKPSQLADELVALALEARRRGETARAQVLLDRAAVSYERETGAVLSLDPPPLGIYPAGVSWSPDGKWLAVLDGPYVSLLSTGPLAHRFRFESVGYRVAVKAQFSLDGSSVLVELCEREATTRCDLRVHRLSDGSLRCSITGPRMNSPRALSADGSLLADTFEASVWDVRTCSKRFEVGRGGNGVGAVAISGDGKWLAVPGEIWDLRQGKQVATFAAPADSDEDGNVMQSLVFRNDSAVLATLGAERTVSLWSVPDGQLLRTLPKLKTTASATITSFDTLDLVVATTPDSLKSGGAAWVFDANSGARKQELKPPKDQDHIWQLELSPDHARVVRFGWGPGAEPAELIELSTGKRLELPHVRNARLAFSPDGKQLAFSTQGEPVKILDARSASEIARLPFGHTSSAGSIRNAVALDKNGQALIIGGEELQIWDLPRGTRRATISQPTWRLVVSPGNLLAAAGWGIHLVDVERGVLAHSIASNSYPFLLGFNRAGDRIAATLEDRSLRLFDAHSGSATATFIGLDEVRSLKALSFSADDRSLDMTGQELVVHADPDTGKLSRSKNTHALAPVGPAGQPFHCDPLSFGSGLKLAELAISADCSTAAIGTSYGPIVVLHPGPGRPALLFNTVRGLDAAFVQSFDGFEGAPRTPQTMASEAWAEWLAAPVEPLGRDARSLLVCRAGARVLALEVCEERLLATSAARTSFFRR